MSYVHHGGRFISPLAAFPRRALAQAQALANEAEVVGMLMDDVLELTETLASPSSRGVRSEIFLYNSRLGE